jgi:hypothetical protein
LSGNFWWKAGYSRGSGWLGTGELGSVADPLALVVQADTSTTAGKGMSGLAKFIAVVVGA